MRKFWKKLTLLGVQQDLSDSDIFKIRFLNGAMGLVAIFAIFETFLFFLLGYHTVLFFSFSLLTIIGISLYFQYIHWYKMALRCFTTGFALSIVAFSILIGGVMSLCSFWIVLATIVFFVKRDSSTKYYYVVGFFLCIVFVFVTTSLYEPLLILNGLESLEMIFIPTALVVQIMLINLFNIELNQQGQKNIEQEARLNYLVSLTQSALESTTDALLIVDKDGQISNYNQKFIEMWELPKEVLASKNDDQVIGYALNKLKEPAKFLSQIKALYNEPNKTSFDLLNFKDGRILERHSQPHRMGKEVVGRVWSFKDVTARKNADLALKERESLFRNLYDYSPVGVVMGTHLGGKLTTANRKFCEMLGYTEEEIKDLTVGEVTHPEDRGHQRQQYQDLLAGIYDSFTMVKRYLRKDGSSFWGHVTISLVKDDEGQIKYDIVIIQDISEKRNAEAALKDSELKFRKIFEDSPFSSLLFKNQSIVSCNEETLRFLQYDNKDELMGQPIGHLSPRVQPNGLLSETIIQSYLEEAKSKGLVQFEWMLKRKNGAEVFTEFTLTSFLLNGENAIYAIIIDKTEAKVNEAKIESLFNALQLKNKELEEKVSVRTLKLQKSNEELLRSNYDLEQFAYIASHDLQEPLRMVGNFVQLLQRKYGSQIGEDGKEYIGFAVDGVTRMSKLIQNLLSYSRVGRKDSAFENANLNHIIDQKVLDLTQRIADQKACVEMQELPQNIQCEPNQLGLVFYNLIGNSLKFNNSETPEVLVTKEEKENEWLFAIRDNGIGIDSRYKDKVFQIFKRLHHREDYEGTGIGLSLCKRIINRHKGDIWFHSEIGKGTTFYFTISKQL